MALLSCYSGFGTLEYGGDLADVLMQVQVPIVSNRLCNKNYQKYNLKIDQSMICAGKRQGGKDACQGDSGGPMVCKHRGKYYLEGAVSWGVGCAEKGNYGVYADIPYFKKWIAKIMHKYWDALMKNVVNKRHEKRKYVFV